MATFLYATGRFTYAWRRWVAIFWVALLGVAGVAVATTESQPATEISIPGTEAQEAFDLLSERFPGMGADGATARVVFRAPDGGEITDPANTAAVGEVVAELERSSDRIAQVADPFESQAISQDLTTAYAQVSYQVSGTELEDAEREALLEAAETGRDAGLVVEIGGDALFEIPSTGVAEVIGVAVAAVVLVITLGSLIAAGLPLITALIGVGIAVSVITVLSGPLELDSTTPILAMMLGLAVGIDYALFIVSRYRAELAAGHDRREAVGRATGTAGSAVVFAGLTVIIAMCGLAVVNIPVLTKMGLAAAGAVAIAVLIGITLIPALLGFAGEKVRPQVSRRAGAKGGAPVEGLPADEERPNAGTRWARFVVRRPIAVLLVAVAGLGVIAVPATQMELNLPDQGSEPPSTTQRQAYDMLAESFGPGFNGPLLVAVDTAGVNNGQDAGAIAGAVAESIQGLDNVVAVTEPIPNETGDTAMLTVIPGSAPSTVETADLVHDLREEAPAFAGTGDARVLVTGQTAMAIDVSERIDDAMAPYLAVVVGLAFVLLTVVFRSLLVPIKAGLGFLLSVFASLGAVVAVFQWGWLAGLFGVEVTGPIMSLMPIFLIGVVFGLAMDYEVFLVTRMREAYVHGEDARQAIVTGFRYSARVVTAAAIIMISVFASFVSADEPMIKMIGFGLAAAILFDAFVVRMAIVPAVLALLGRTAWWLPAWLDRILPNVDVEGEKLTRRSPAAEPVAAGVGSTLPAGRGDGAGGGPATGSADPDRRADSASVDAERDAPSSRRR
ncbi:MMPL family transporter [Streptomyces calidiresistens]|uniref:MMPL family transporter n=1 Tax=Streptomyces calidiresistens TaxID=1485586 RepID=A0A7W3T5T1_9ACTN|nr:MMPL family transporter [Streptomyces calidiresistens]MBB0231452.1 MMPL family transporter [Streptomyces calidiresistens]